MSQKTMYLQHLKDRNDFPPRNLDNPAAQQITSGNLLPPEVSIYARYKDPATQTQPIWDRTLLDPLVAWIMEDRFYWDIIADGWRDSKGDEDEVKNDFQASLVVEKVVNHLAPAAFSYPARSRLEEILEVVRPAAKKQNRSLYRSRIENNVPEWDGKDRLDAFTVLLGAVNRTEYCMLLQTMMIALIGRIYTPGLKWDFMPILQGPQGIGKSTFFMKLLEAIGLESGFISVSSDALTSDQKLLEQSKCKFILEFEELAGIRKASMTGLKRTISRTSTTARLSYRREPTTQAHHFIIVGTTNDNEFLSDLTGNRRFPIIKTGRQQPTLNLWTLEGKEYLAQLWAQMLQEYKQAVKRGYLQALLCLHEDDARRFEAEATAAIAGGAYESDIENYLEGLDGPVCAKQIVIEGLGIEPTSPEYKRVSTTDVPRTLKKSGWVQQEQKQTLQPWGRRYYWRKPAPKAEER